MTQIADIPWESLGVVNTYAYRQNSPPPKKKKQHCQQQQQQQQQRQRVTQHSQQRGMLAKGCEDNVCVCPRECGRADNGFEEHGFNTKISEFAGPHRAPGTELSRVVRVRFRVRFRVRLRRLSGVWFCCLLCERPTRETQAEQYSDTVLELSEFLNSLSAHRVCSRTRGVLVLSKQYSAHFLKMLWELIV